MSNEDIAKTTAYDARLQFLEVIGGILKTNTICWYSGDLEGVHRSLKRLLNMLRIYMKQEEWKELISKLESAKKLLNNRQLRVFAEKQLDDVDSVLYSKAMHVFMPISSDDFEEEIDWEKINKEMDL